MTALENYKSILNQYFGPDTATFQLAPESPNSVIGGLNNEQFVLFKNCFLKRIERLSAIYKGHQANLRNLVLALNEVSSTRNWEGAYSELVAFDFLNSNKDYLPTPIELSKSVSASETFGSSLGMKNVNFDGYYPHFNICFDVKVLLDKSRNMLESVISKAKKEHGNPQVSILPEYPLDMGYDILEPLIGKLVTELGISIEAAPKSQHVKSALVPDLSFRLQWGDGVAMTVGTYDPYQHAKNHHRLLFTHAKKFSRNEASIIVFVVFPWFSESFLSLGVFDTTIFYRSFCRRFFCAYAQSDVKATTIINTIKDETTLAELTSGLSGVMFIEDTSILSETPTKQNVNAYAYLNPNATQKVSCHYRTYLQSLGVAIDDFEHDNY